LTVIFEQAAENYLTQIIISIIRGGDNRVDVGWLSDDALDIFSTVGGDGLSF